ncbi:MAG: site-specific integrase [Saccharofermentans sp.]|nr:site-specific integrase [Saccharofermentans sp.]
MNKARYTSKRERLNPGEYQRPNGTYKYVWKDSLGKSHETYAKTLNQLRVKEKDIQNKLSMGIAISRQTTNDFNEIRINNMKNLKNSTLHSYNASYSRYVSDSFIGKSKIQDIKHSDIVRFYNDLLEKKGIRTSTLSKLHVVLSQVFQIAVLDGILASNPCDGAMKSIVKSEQNMPKTVKALTREQQHIFEDYLKRTNSLYYPIFTFMLWTGCRVGEATAITTDDFSFEKNELYINKALAYYDRKAPIGSVLELTTPKTRTSVRTIPLNGMAKMAILAALENNSKGGITCKSDIGGHTNFIFLNTEGHVFNYKKLNTRLNHICEKIRKEGHPDFPHISCHSLRHSFATRMNESGLVDVRAISAILGHKETDITINTYIDATEEYKAAQMKIFENSFKSSDDE